MTDFIRGFKYLLSGFALIRQPGVRLYVIIPLLINALLFAGAIIYGAGQMGDLMAWLTAKWQWLEWLSWLLWPLFVIIILTVVFFSFSIVANLLAAPFNGFLAQAVEQRLRGAQPVESGGIAALPQQIIDGIKSEFHKFLYFLIRVIPLLLLFVIPLVMTAAPFIWFLFGAWMFALEYLEFPMGNHGLLFHEVRSTIRTRRRLSFGFGIGVMLLTMIPVVNFLAMPVAVAGATRLWIENFVDNGGE